MLDYLQADVSGFQRCISCGRDAEHRKFLSTNSYVPKELEQFHRNVPEPERTWSSLLLRDSVHRRNCLLYVLKVNSHQFRRVTGQSRHSQKIYSIMDFLLRYLHSSGSVPAQVRQSLCRRPSVIFRFLPTDIFGLFGRLTVA
ncbi:hypothetical protein J6590_075219 [Homalodisca vitripennis]|nr:hypothetical protein J6590_075219 [Homalodisca vitripennis]